MPSVNVRSDLTDPTHDISLSDGTNTYGLIFSRGGTRVLQEFPLSPPAQAFENEQKNWIGGRGRLRFDDDPTGYFDDSFLWSTTDERLLPSLQWRYAQGIRSADTLLPGDNETLSWWKLYGNTPASNIARYLAVLITASASYNMDKGYLIVRRRGTPGTLTFELCDDDSGDPGTVLKTVTKTTSDITDTLSVFQVFDWTTTQAVTASDTYQIKIYGAATDNAANHWEVLVNDGGSASKYSSDDTTWAAANASMYYRVVVADTARQWRFFYHEGGLYAVSQNDAGGAPTVLLNGVRGTATSATATTLTCSGLSMTADRFIGAYIRIYDGAGDGQIRVITDNDATSFTVATWDITPDTTSKFLVYSTDWWTTIASHGMNGITGAPVSAGAVCYFPQGNNANIRRMQVNGASHDWAADGDAAHIMTTTMDNAALKLVRGSWGTSTISLAPAVAWGNNLVWGTARTIGTTQYRITNFHTHNKTLHIFKEDGVYTYNGGVVEKLGNNFENIPDQYLGIGAASQNQYLWFGWNHSVERMLGANIDDMLNFKRGYAGMPTNRRGNPSSIVSAVGWLFFAIDGGASNYSSIVVWNGFGWHEIFRGPAVGVRIRNMVWQPSYGVNRPRLWFDLGGDIAYIEFPLWAANPTKSSINYHHEGVCVTSTYDAHDQNLYKVVGLLRVFLEQAGGGVEIDYQTNANVGTDTWTVLGTADSTPVEDIDINLGEIFQIRFRFRLQVASTRTPPVLSGWQLSGRLMPLDKYQFMCTFRADSDAETKTDEPDHNPDTVYEQLQTWARQQTKLTLQSTVRSVDNNTAGRTVTVALPTKHVRSLDTEERKWTGEIQVAILEV